MSLAHPRPWLAWYETTVKERRRDGKRGYINVEYWGVVDARGVFIAEGLDEDTAREIADKADRAAHIRNSHKGDAAK